MSRNLSPEHPSAPSVGGRFERGCATFEHVFGLPAKTFLDALADVMPAALPAMRTAKDLFTSVAFSKLST